MNDAYLTPIELYMRRGYKLLVMLVPITILCASATFTVIKLCGLYPTVSWSALLVFDAVDFIFLAVSLYLLRHCEAENKMLKPEFLRAGKIYIALLILIQWNLISYIIPSSDFWAYAPFFTLFAVPFLDSAFVALVSSGILVSVAVSWFIRKEILLPARDALFLPNMILRCVLLLLFEAFLCVLTYLLQNVLLKDIDGIASYDALTRLRNRRSLYKCIGGMKKRQKRSHETFSVLMCDLDDFKKVNDTYGHKCGDLVLQTVAEVISRSVGKQDIVFRYGGEEILVLVSGNLSEACETAEKIRTEVMNKPVYYGNQTVHGTLTVGAAEYAPGLSDDEFIALADRRLYLGKQNGKNRVVSSDECIS